MDYKGHVFGNNCEEDVLIWIISEKREDTSIIEKKKTGTGHNLDG